MARNATIVTAGKRTLEVTNLEKVLYPEDHILKAEIIQYYLRIAPTILYHIKGRPLTLIRYPDGIEGERFYQKNRPRWSSDWIEFERLGQDEPKDYIIATEPASLVWLANLAALELHQMHCRQPRFGNPDYMVFDLDPPENAAFSTVVEVAYLLKQHIESFGYHSFVKTTGGKGLHIVIPLEPKWDFSTVFEAAKEVAQPFVQRNSNTVTLYIRKNERKGRILVDIYRNRSGQSIVSPYSLRGRKGAPVSMPIYWDELSAIKESVQFNIFNVIDKIMADGDAWEGIGGWAATLHTQEPRLIPVRELSPSSRRKTAEQLQAYSQKRDFGKTSEPLPSFNSSGANRFVIHRHHATRLHYDLRLEKDGVLKSWAVPKGFPQRPGIKRLAIETEDHPLEYLHFEGAIPKEEYGGGQMWIFADGYYEITKQKENGMYFRLESAAMSGEYRMHLMKEKEWLLEKVEKSQIDWLVDPINPMLAESDTNIPDGDDYIYEVKWDGIRTLISLDEGVLRFHTRNQNEVSRQFPELQIAPQAFRATTGLFDAEIVCLDQDGKPEFKRAINRLMSSDDVAIQHLSKTNPANCYLFDCLYLDGRAVTNEPLLKRREWLKDSLKKGTPYRVSEAVNDGRALFEAARKHNLEGIMAKKKSSSYLPGKRSNAWLKIKIRKTADCLVIGYTQGKGDRHPYFGALHLAERVHGKLAYRGKVGTGFPDATMKEITELLNTIPTTSKPIDNNVLEESKTTWIDPALVVEVTYASLTPDEIFREAVFVRLRPDKSVLNLEKLTAK